MKIYDGRILKTQDQVKARTHEYQKIQKEYRGYLKDRKKLYSALKDSLHSLDSMGLTLPVDSLKKLSGIQEEYFVYADSLYSLKDLSNLESVKRIALDESVSVIREKLSGNQYLAQFDRLKEEIGGYRQVLRQYRDSLGSIDSLSKEELDFMVQQRKQELAKEYGGKLESIAGTLVNEKLPVLPDGFQSEELAQFQKAQGHLAEGLNTDKKVNLSKAQSLDHFKDKQEILENARSEAAKLKKTYSEVNDLHDLSTAKKSSSLSGARFSERLVFGGTFQLHLDEDTKIDLNPELSYRISKKFEAGIGGTYRLTVATKDLPQVMDDPMVMGFRGFVEHRLFKDFFVHGEYEGLKGSIPQVGDLSGKDWYFSFLAGIERRFNLKEKAQAQAQVLYNFNSQGNPSYGSPWVFRVGFNVSGKE